MGFDFIVIAPLLPSHCGFSFVFGCGVSFLVSSGVFLSMILNLFMFNFFNFLLRWIFVAVSWISLVEVSGGYSLSQCTGFSLQWLLLLRSMGSRLVGFSSCGTQAQ